MYYSNKAHAGERKAVPEPALLASSSQCSSAHVRESDSLMAAAGICKGHTGFLVLPLSFGLVSLV